MSSKKAKTITKKITLFELMRRCTDAVIVPKVESKPDVLIEGFGPMAKKVQSLLESTLEKAGVGPKALKIEIASDHDGNVSFIPFAVVVPTANGNGHSYPIGQPVVMLQGDVGLLVSTGKTGNHLTTTREELRAATDEEIEVAIMSLLELSENPEDLFEDDEDNEEEEEEEEEEEPF